VGTLFGALVARALDRWWDALDRPDPFVVVDAGAGRGRLAADVLLAAPSGAPALRYVMVERSPVLLAAQREVLPIEPAEDALGPAARTDPDEPAVAVTGVGPIVTSLPDLPASPIRGVVIANELLDNLPFCVVEWSDDGWLEVRVGVDDGKLVEVLVPAPGELAVAADRVAAGTEVPAGVRLPVPTGTAAWLQGAGDVLRRGYLVVVDYAADAVELASRGQVGWLRTYRGHDRGDAPLVAPGSQDLTCDVPLEYLVESTRRAGFALVEHTTQAEWLRSLGVDELAETAADAWRARASVGDLEAVAARSRVHEADALADPAGLGAHHVFVFEKVAPG
jgi:NADH dehydrogenase [ubiquinone] 1 alpha subcomplex assembly factor 7